MPPFLHGLEEQGPWRIASAGGSFARLGSEALSAVKEIAPFTVKMQVGTIEYRLQVPFWLLPDPSGNHEDQNVDELPVPPTPGGLSSLLASKTASPHSPAVPVEEDATSS